jgi:hypothetical protein
MLLVCASAGAFRLASAGAAGAEDAAVRKTLELYFRGHATGDGEYFRKAFHPEAKLFAIRDGKFWELPSADYIARASGKPAPDEASRKRTVESVDITGNVAVAKLVLDYPDARLTDYMTLLKVDGDWKIINKAFHAEPKAK